MQKTILGSVARGAVLGILLGAVFMAGFFVRGIPPVAAAMASVAPTDNFVPMPNLGQMTTPQYALLAQAQGYIDQHYLRERPPQTQLEYGAIRGLIATLNDRYTFFIDPPVAASESNVLAGQYGGIGVQVKRDEAGRFVLFPFREGPAAKAGLQDGDILLKVNNEEVPLTTQQDAVDQMLRGEVKDNNGVTITIKRGTDDDAEEKEFTIPFAVIEVPSVVWRVLSEDAELGYIQILRFTSRTPEELEKAIAELRDQKIKGLVVDLRNNPGGLLQESIEVAGQFLDGGVVLYERTRDGEKTYEAPAGGKMLDLPLVTLINGGTASAAELVAGAIKDRNRGILIGQQSYGKGSIQLIFSLADQSSLHITTAEWFPPSRTPLDGVGLPPTINMIPDTNGRDVELGEAIRYLSDKKAQ